MPCFRRLLPPRRGGGPLVAGVPVVPLRSTTGYHLMVPPGPMGAGEEMVTWAGDGYLGTHEPPSPLPSRRDARW